MQESTIVLLVLVLLLPVCIWSLSEAEQAAFASGSDLTTPSEESRLDALTMRLDAAAGPAPAFWGPAIGLWLILVLLLAARVLVEVRERWCESRLRAAPSPPASRPIRAHEAVVRTLEVASRTEEGVPPRERDPACLRRIGDSVETGLERSA